MSENVNANEKKEVMTILDPEQYAKYQSKTIDTYNLIAKQWAAAHEGKVDWQEELEYFHDRFLQTGKVIDIGCGSGRDLKALSAIGNYDCYGADASEELLKIAKSKVPNGNFILKNIYSLSDLKQRFDGFISIAVLLHIPRFKVNLVLQEIRSVLKPGAVGIITLKNGRGEEFEIRDVDGRHEERLFTYWSKKEFEVELDNNGFEVVRYTIKPLGRSNWHCFFVKLKQ